MHSRVRPEEESKFTKDLRRLDAEGMARLLEVQENAEDLWSTDDLAQLFRHQLSMSIRREIVRASRDLEDEEEPGRSHEVSESTPVYPVDVGSRDATFGQVLHGNAPDLELLRAIKRYAKREWRSHDAQLPKEVSIALYFLSIASGIARWGQRISGLEAERLCRGFQAVLQAEWLDATSRDVLQGAVERLEKEG